MSKEENKTDWKLLTTQMVEEYDRIERLRGTKEHNGLMIVFNRNTKNLTKQAEKSAPKELFLSLLEAQRTRGIIHSKHEYVLNENEAKKIKDECSYTNPLRSGSMLSFASIGGDYPFKKAYDEIRKAFIYTVFINRTVTGEEQMTPQLMQKINRGINPDEKDYTPEKTLWYRFTAIEKEFNKYFTVN
jgi:hypothetical protein